MRKLLHWIPAHDLIQFTDNYKIIDQNVYEIDINCSINIYKQVLFTIDFTRNTIESTKDCVLNY